MTSMTSMKRSPEIEWLAAKWDLPEPAFEAVQRLMKAETEGSTACELPPGISKWGKAAVPETESSDAPLVIVEDKGKTFLQSRLLFEAEREIANRLLKLADGESPSQDLDKKLKAIFPETAKGDKQVEAARTAASKNLTVITGGPGTGKTFTLARILALLAQDTMAAGAIRLAAPTGKAADRMKKAVIQSLAGLPETFQKDQEILTRIAESSSTIHSLLGYRPDTGRCRFDPENPLPCEVLILDECSMVDVHLWRTLLRALPSQVRLILLGDPNQLESVGQGNVFAELAHTAESLESSLHPSHVHLTEARRFKDRRGISDFASALENSDPEAAAALLENSRGDDSTSGLTWLETSGGTLPCASFPKPVLNALEKVATAKTPQAALDALAGVCILTAQREYFVGSMATSREIETFFSRRENARNHPVIINRNDPETGLRNGSVGIIHASSDGKRKAFFPSGDSLKEFPLSKLPEYSPAWAITIHRSQGSEYDNVLVILPREESPMATRELLYTAITRARENVYIAGDIGSIKKAAGTSSNRCSLLGAFLQP